MDLEELKQRITSKNGKLNTNYRVKLSSDEKEYIISLYPLYSELNDACNALVYGDYKRCPVCLNIMPYYKTNDLKTCASAACKETLRKKSHDQNNLAKYGVTNVFASQHVKDKIKQTNRIKYGTDHHTQNEEYKQNRKDVVMQKYGVEHLFQVQDIQNKIKQTNLMKYGNINYLNSDIANKQRLKYIQNYIYNKIGIYVSLSDVEQYKINPHIHDYSNEFLYSLVNSNMGKSTIDSVYQSTYSRYEKYELHDIDININSSGEIDIHNFLTSLGVKFITNSRDIIKPLELDIYIPEYNLAIEYNGSYWHSERFKDKHYHQNKTKLCNEKGITLIHIYEYIYNSKAHIYHSIIKAKLGLNERIYARKCTLKEVSKTEEKEFLNNYHLQGYTPSKICYGLYFDKKLVTICSFKKSRFDKNYEYELLRNCTLSDITVVGGLSKLIKHFKNKYNQSEIVCYSDASISFNKHSKLTDPNYVWFNNIVLSRYQTMKHLLPKLLGDNFDPTLTEKENMINNNFYRIFDSGNYKTIL